MNSKAIVSENIDVDGLVKYFYFLFFQISKLYFVLRV